MQFTWCCVLVTDESTCVHCASGESINFGAAECNCRVRFNYTWDCHKKLHAGTQNTCFCGETVFSLFALPQGTYIVINNTHNTTRSLAFSISLMDKFHCPIYFSDVLFHAVPSTQCHYTCLGVYLWWDPKGQKLRQNTKSSWNSWTEHNKHFPANYRGPVRLGLGKHRNESER